MSTIFALPIRGRAAMTGVPDSETTRPLLLLSAIGVGEALNVARRSRPASHARNHEICKKDTGIVKSVIPSGIGW